MRRFLGGLLALLLMTACRDVPKDVIAKRKMVNVLTDLHLIEGYLMSMPQDSMRLVARQYYQAIYDKYNTDSAGLYNSIAYYSSDPTELDKMYEAVQRRLTALEQEEQNKTEAKMRQEFVRDSIHNVHLSDSIRRIALDSVRLKWSSKLVFKDSLDQAAVDTSLGKSDSIPPIGIKDPWLRRQDRLLQYLGAGKLVLPFLTNDLVMSTTSSKGPSAPKNNAIGQKASPTDLPVQVKVDSKPAASPNLKPDRPIGKPEQMKEQQ